jgi:hypothetical protein
MAHQSPPWGGFTLSFVRFADNVGASLIGLFAATARREKIHTFRDASMMSLTTRAANFAAALAILIALPADRARAIAIGQLDDFAVDLESWTQGRPPADGAGLTRAAAGGPAGAGDAFMQIVSDTQGTHRTIIAFNFTPSWTGDYLAAQVAGITMDANNPGAAPLNLRLAIGSGVIPDSPGSWLASTASINLPAGAGWTSITFPLAAADLTLVQNAGGATYQSVMSSVAAIRLLHTVLPDNRGTSVTATLGVDNIRAVGVPEPSTAALLAAATATALRRRRAI